MVKNTLTSLVQPILRGASHDGAMLQLTQLPGSVPGSAKATLVALAAFIMLTPASHARAPATPEAVQPTTQSANLALAPQAATDSQFSLLGQRTIQRAADGLFYVTARANGETVRFVVDTGASVVVLSGADAHRLGVAVDKAAPARIRTAGGGAAMRWGNIEELELAGKRMTNLKAAIVDQGLPVSLMGQNALARLGSVTLRGDTLQIE